MVAYAQGFDQIAAGSEEYDWNIDRGAMATIWRGGCIIRARFLEPHHRGVRRAIPNCPACWSAPYFADAVADGVDGWRRVVAARGPRRRPDAGVLLLAGLLRRAAPAERLPAALIQGLRDNFGAHTYRRVDSDGSFHTLWASDHSEVSA